MVLSVNIGEGYRRLTTAISVFITLLSVGFLVWAHFDYKSAVTVDCNSVAFLKSKNHTTESCYAAYAVSETTLIAMTVIISSVIFLVSLLVQRLFIRTAIWIRAGFKVNNNG
jgi:hypothetical protein